MWPIDFSTIEICVSYNKIAISANTIPSLQHPFQRNTYACIVHSSFKSYHDSYRILNYGKYSNYSRVVRYWLLVLYIHSLPYTKQQTIVSRMNDDFHAIRIKKGLVL